MYQLYEHPYPAFTSALYLRDSDGNDWYESQAQFLSDSLKVVVDNGRVRAASYDVSALWPVGAIVVEIPKNSVPTSFSVDEPMRWDVVDGALCPHLPTNDELASIARRRRDIELQEALKMLDRHEQQISYDLPRTLTNEQAKLWAIYAQALRDVPQQAGFPTQIEWPAAPA
ncbi:phage tail assembly chaperone [Chromobacterium haemolyticum]|uniref:phage tail assembly chaperone n=1 Tax=Chromobacterium haemolyticum TaxID=394935 RepID=UPI000DEFEC85|nr:phage tail assembly chaperone [Chromobacterium haemolyticum]